MDFLRRLSWAAFTALTGSRANEKMLLGQDGRCFGTLHEDSISASAGLRLSHELIDGVGLRLLTACRREFGGKIAAVNQSAALGDPAGKRDQTGLQGLLYKPWKCFLSVDCSRGLNLMDNSSRWRPIFPDFSVELATKPYLRYSTSHCFRHCCQQDLRKASRSCDL